MEDENEEAGAVVEDENDEAEMAKAVAALKLAIEQKRGVGVL